MFNKSGFTLFYSMPLDRQDWANLAASGVKQVMLVWDMADNATLRECQRRGLRVVLRMDSHNLTQDPGTLQGYMLSRSALCDLAGVIMGSEPDDRYSMEWGHDWGLDRAWQHRDIINRVLNALAGHGVPIVSPGHMQRPYLENDQPQPGQVSWREICTPVYNQCDANGVHIYAYHDADWKDELRFLYQIRWWGALRHKALWIDECGIGAGDQTTRINAVLHWARLLLDPVAGSRVDMLCPFVSNGTGVGYDPGYILRDPAVYRLIREYMAH